MLRVPPTSPAPGDVIAVQKHGNRGHSGKLDALKPQQVNVGKHTEEYTTKFHVKKKQKLSTVLQRCQIIQQRQNPLERTLNTLPVHSHSESSDLPLFLLFNLHVHYVICCLYCSRSTLTDFFTSMAYFNTLSLCRVQLQKEYFFCLLVSMVTCNFHGVRT